MQAATPRPRLSAARLPLDDWLALDGPAAHLGALAYGIAGEEGPPSPVEARLLAGLPPRVDAWHGGGPLREAGTLGRVRFRHDGHWLYGTLAIDEAAAGGDLAALTQQAYRDVFDTLAHTGCPHLLRLWNYLPDIHADQGGLERYRQFNAGRQQAFLAARYAAFEGAPAACALGTRGGRFRVHFLAGRARPVAIENPRQVPAYHYPVDYGPRSPTFSRAALAEAGDGRLALLVSGTASIVGHASRHAGDVRAQTRETLANLQAVIGAAHARGSARFALRELECTVYVRHATELAAIRAVLEQELGADAPALRGAVFLEADICRADLRVEIEAHAFAAGALNA